MIGSVIYTLVVLALIVGVIALDVRIGIRPLRGQK